MQEGDVGSSLFLPAVWAKPEELEPVLGDLESRFSGNGSDESFEIIAFENGRFTALPAQEQVLVAGGCRNERLASLRLVDALNKSLLLECFECTINGDQPQRRVVGPRLIKDLDGGERVGTLSHDLDNGTARLGQAISLFVQLEEPGMFIHVAS
jgi:hypothetical protein